VVIPNLAHSEYTYQTLKGGVWKWPQSFWVWPKDSELLDKTILEWVKGH